MKLTELNSKRSRYRSCTEMQVRVTSKIIIYNSTVNSWVNMQ